jgi:hypothetical protein
LMPNRADIFSMAAGMRKIYFSTFMGGRIVGER